MKLNLGSGSKRIDGFTNVDILDVENVDIVLDLRNTPWPWEENSVEEVFSGHFVEHLTGTERIGFFNELYRVLKPGAKATIITPDWSNACAYGDPTHCFSEDTEILTSEGWKLIKETTIGEHVLSLDLETEKAKYSKISNIIVQPYVGKMLHFLTKRMDLMVTPNHDLIWRSKGNKGYARPVLRKSPAETFVGLGGHHPRRASAVIQWDGSDIDRIRIAEDEIYNGRVLSGEFDAEALSELVGWFVSEGTVDLSSANHYRIAIAQSSSANESKVSEIIDVIKRLGFSPSVKHDRIVFSCKPLALWLSKLGSQDIRYIPNEIKQLSPRLLKIFIEAAVKGDGSVQSYGTKNGAGFTYATISERLAGDMQEVVLKAGYRSTVFVERRAGHIKQIHGREIIDSHDMYFVSICDPTDAWYPAPKEVMYSGSQVCVTVENHHNILVRRNGRAIWAGNCWPPMSSWYALYLNKAWRDLNAPHVPYTCDFSWVHGVSWEDWLSVRPDEMKQFAMQRYINSARDLHITLAKQ